MKAQRGNILFLILLAVILFAALSYAVTSSVQGGGKNVSDEQAEAAAAQILGSLNGLENGLQRFLMSRNFTTEQIDINDPNNPMAGSMGNSSGCSANTCNLMHPLGGGMTLPIIDAKYSRADACGRTGKEPIVPTLIWISVLNVGTTAPEIVLNYCGVEAAVCDQINYKMGVLNKGDTGLSGALGTFNVDYTYWSGAGAVTQPSPTPNRIGAADARVSGHRVLCARLPAGFYSNNLYYVLQAR